MERLGKSVRIKFNGGSPAFVDNKTNKIIRRLTKEELNKYLHDSRNL